MASKWLHKSYYLFVVLLLSCFVDVAYLFDIGAESAEVIWRWLGSRMQLKSKCTN
jgi:hypothetical protein